MASGDIEYRCFVGGLAWATDNDALEKAFSPYGEIVESKVINDRETGRSRGFGFVTFASEQTMRDAIEGMNGGYSRGGGGGYGGGGRRESGGYSRNGGGGYGGGGYGGGGYGGGGYGGGRDRGYGERGYGDGGSRYSKGGGVSDGNWRN
ncbi:glycine-rich RNA-binding protein GRP2A-like isoform X8 [Gastrolobium bilobum]|uniref:glycine-rich RNA-binding protein GRP2A-like isoform X8 n=1 Tax=Gastrolobium bilobum TaxID=150636 RepID=UPI002AB216A1|nr:glycine-rich RNA-binding protein GRP2A-like isoform X8 [Gastrolobium bilobum]